MTGVQTCALPILQRRSNWKFNKQEGAPSIAPKISKNENLINWTDDATKIFNNFRALDFNGGVHTLFRGEKLEILDANVSDIKLDVGCIHISNHSLYVGTSGKALEILEVKPAGKKAMKVKEWLNGARISAGEKFE